MRRHDLDLFSLIAGLVFVGIAFGHILDVASDVDFDGRWIIPFVLVALGVAGLAGILRTKDDETRDLPADAVTDDEPVEMTAGEGGEGAGSR